MIKIYVIAIVLITIFYTSTFFYRKKLRKNLNRKDYPLKALFGMAMFMVDKFPIAYAGKGNSLNKAIRKISVKEDIKKEKYLYIVNKVSYCILCGILAVVLGLGIEISGSESNEPITSVKRDSIDDEVYNIYYEDDSGAIKPIELEVGKKELKDEEILKIIKGYQEELVQKALGKNDNAQNVTKPLNLIGSIGEENILVSWEISDSDIIDYDGKISSNVDKEGELIYLTAIMTYEKVTLEYVFSVNVYPHQGESDAKKEVQAYVDNQDIYDSQVNLPEKIDGKKVKYYSSKGQNSYVIVTIGLILSVALFFFKDRDIKDKIEDRNEQLLEDYPEIVNKLLLYHNAGLSVKSAIEKIVSGYKEDKKEYHEMLRYAYEELEISLIQMKSGVSEITAINNYGKNCGLHCYVKLSGIIEQNIRRGTNAMTVVLENELESSMIEKKNTMLKAGGKISTKLMGPMIVMLIVAMAIIMVPAFLSMNL